MVHKIYGGRPPQFGGCWAVLESDSSPPTSFHFESIAWGIQFNVIEYHLSPSQIFFHEGEKSELVKNPSLRGQAPPWLAYNLNLTSMFIWVIIYIYISISSDQGCSESRVWEQHGAILIVTWLNENDRGIQLFHFATPDHLICCRGGGYRTTERTLDGGRGPGGRGVKPPTPRIRRDSTRLLFIVLLSKELKGCHCAVSVGEGNHFD